MIDEKGLISKAAEGSVPALLALNNLLAMGLIEADYCKIADALVDEARENKWTDLAVTEALRLLHKAGWGIQGMVEQLILYGNTARQKTVSTFAEAFLGAKVEFTVKVLLPQPTADPALLSLN